MCRLASLQAAVRRARHPAECGRARGDGDADERGVDGRSGGTGGGGAAYSAGAERGGGGGCGVLRVPGVGGCGVYYGADVECVWRT